MPDTIRIGVSSCLLGEKVRYDGGHKLDRYITDTLGRFFTFVPVCPEVESGLSVPREAMRLEGDPAEPRLVTSRTGVDLTGRMQEYCRRKILDLEREGLSGFIFKKGSPSSGLNRVKVYTKEGGCRTGRGMFAAAVAEHFPLLPVEEEGRLADPGLRENFLERVFAYRRWQDLMQGKQDRGALIEFHTAHKLQIMAHSPRHYRVTGKLVAEGKQLDEFELFARYEKLFMEALALQATVKKNTNVLQHIMGYFKKEITAAEKAELLEIIERYHDHLVPLVVPITLIWHYVRKFDCGYLKEQVYLNPHPKELMLRNHA